MSETIVQIMIDRNIIQSKDRELYIFCFKFITEYLLFILVSEIIGVMFQLALPTAVFLITFIAMRSFGGGFHARSELLCMIYSFSTVILYCIISTLLLYIWSDILFFCINVVYLLSSVLYVFLSPVDPPNKKISQEKYVYYKTRSVFVCIIITIIYFVLVLSEQHLLYSSIAIGSIVSSMSLLIRRCRK